MNIWPRHRGAGRAKSDPAGIPSHGGPVTGNGRGSVRKGTVKGVVFRTADGKPAGTVAGKASRLRTIGDTKKKK